LPCKVVVRSSLSECFAASAEAERLPRNTPETRYIRTRLNAPRITRLPKAEHEAQEWQAAMEALMLVATSGGPTMFARIGVMRALNRHVERVFDPSRKEKHWGRRKLKRDE
jgi:hypothetical protein